MLATEFNALVVAAWERYWKMTLEQRQAMWDQQRAGYASAEASWPKPKFKWVNGAKVYDSLEDYCND